MCVSTDSGGLAAGLVAESRWASTVWSGEWLVMVPTPFEKTMPNYMPFWAIRPGGYLWVDPCGAARRYWTGHDPARPNFAAACTGQ